MATARAAADPRNLVDDGLLDWTQEQLSRLIRYATVNPPGDEAAAIAYIADVLSKEGLDPQVFESAPGRANLVCRIPGTDKADPLMLAGHVDVVEVERESWSHDPFSGDVHDGCLWGRGAVDMKGKIAMDLAAMAAIQRSGRRPDRDVVMCVVADEEAGCEYGSKWMVENHPELLRAGVCLNEVGGFSMSVMGVRYYPIQVAEKGMCWLRLTARGRPGHGSVPNPRSAPVKIAQAIAKLAETRLPLHVTDPASQFIDALADPQPLPVSIALRGLTLPYVGDPILDYGLAGDQAGGLDAILRNTVSPTVVRAGSKTNVIPGVATVELDGRTVPGQSPEDLIREIYEVIGDQFEVEILRAEDATVTSADTPEYETIARTIKKHDPEGIPVPWMIPGFTDDKFYATLGAKCYGFAPLKLPPDMKFMSMFHGHDERVPVDGYRWGVETYIDGVSRLIWADLDEQE